MTDEQIRALFDTHLAVQVTGMKDYTNAVLNAAKDCRTCGKARKSGHQCGSTAACIDGDQYQPTQPVRLWEK